MEQEAPDLTESVEEFRAAARTGLKQSLMVAAAELGGALIEGGLRDALDNAREVLALAPRGADPIAYTSFLNVYGGVLLVNGRYEEALEHMDALTALAVSNAIPFAIPYAQIQRAKALIGLRRFTLATRTLALLERQMQDKSNVYFHGRIQIERARLYASVGDLERALGVLSLGLPPRISRTDGSLFLGWQALLTAVAGDSDRAHAQAANARRAGRGMEVENLTLLAEAVSALADGNRREAAARLGKIIKADVCDPIVIAVRATPPLGAFIAAQPRWRSWFQQLLTASRDASVAASLGLRVPREAKERTALSPRETEVHELLAQGLTNEEIAKLLYISVSTTKVHVKHIYEKLGVRSRLEAARALRGDV
jgi:ATP/maltotriose-dependent transcriptional regulator MalT